MKRMATGVASRHCVSVLAGKRCKGFTYLGLLVMVAIIGIAAAATLQLGSLLQRRAAEEELLYIGMQYRNALISYSNATPAGQPRQPRSLEDLVKDPRYPGVKRYLRRLYADPVTGKQEWGTIQAEGGGIIGVYSLSTAIPIKAKGFEDTIAEFAGASSYRDWRFTVLPVLPPVSQLEQRNKTDTNGVGK
jgi:type II secretory pathway pseudopilin PulG